MMPKVSGIQVCQEIRKEYTLLELPVLLLTVKNLASEIDIGFKSGANDYLTKPFNREELLARIKTLLKLKKLSNIINEINIELEDKVRERTVELKKKSEILIKANEELKLFSSIVAHDLQSPLNVIEGCIQQILDDELGLSEETKMEYIYDIKETEQDMLETIKSLLDISMINTTEMKFERVNLSNIFRNCLVTLQKIDKEHNPKIIIEDEIYVMGDKNMLYRLIDNLLSNAWKFTADVGNPQIHFGKIESDGKTIYFIRDNGIGFDVDDSNKLFDIYHRHKSDNYEGYGIGLNIVKRVIDRHNGEIWTESKKGEGAIFYFRI